MRHFKALLLVIMIFSSFVFFTRPIYAADPPVIELLWSVSPSKTSTLIGPLAADLIADEPGWEIVVTGITPGAGAENRQGEITVLYANGTIAYTVPGYPISVHQPFEISDLDNDGVPEIIVTAWDSVVALHGNNGSEYWRTYVPADDLWPIVFDIDGDSYPEVFVSSGEAPWNVYADTITSLSYDGYVMNQAFSWHPCFGGLALADANFDGSYELYQGDRAMTYSAGIDAYKGGARGVRALDAHTLTPIWNEMTPLSSSHTPILDDVDGDGVLDVIAIDQNSNSPLVLNSDDGSVLTTGGIYRKSSSSQGFTGHSQPTVYDIDGDGKLEIISCAYSQVKIWDLVDWKMDALLVDELGNPLIAMEPPKVGDVTGDGVPDIIVPAAPPHENPYVNQHYALYIYSFDPGTGEYIIVHKETGLWGILRPFSLIQDVDNDGLNELVFTSGEGIVYYFDTLGLASSPPVRSETSFYSEYRRGAAVYVPSLVPDSPVLRDEYPLNSSLNQTLNPTLAVQATDFQGDSMNITFSTNASGPWVDIGSYVEVLNGVYNVTPVGMDTLGTKYYWRVTATDGVNPRTETYSFTTYSNPPTQDSPILVSSGVTPPSTYDNLTSTPQGTTDPDGDDVTNIYNWYVNGESWTGLHLPFDTRTTDNPLVLDELFADGFEDDFSKWNENGVTDWSNVTGQKYSGSYSAYASSSSTYLTSDDFDTSATDGFIVSFWYRDNGIDDDDNVYLQFWTGTSYDNIFELGNNPEDTWHFYSFQTYHPRYLIDDFHVRFDANGSDSGEELWLDDIEITAPTRTMDYSGEDNHGTVVGATWIEDGLIGGAYSFDGSDYMRVPDDPTLDGAGSWDEITIEFWIKPDISTYGTVLVNKAVVGSTGNYRVRLLDSSSYINRIQWGVRTDSGFSQISSNAQTQIDVGTWNHVVCTYKSGPGLTVYINGTERQSLAKTGNIAISPGDSIYDAPIFIGHDGSSKQERRWLKGALDEVRIYKRALTPEQVMQNFLDVLDGSSDSTIVSNETLGQDEWLCEVTPNDSFVDGETKPSNTLVVANSAPPEASNLQINNRARGEVLDDDDLVALYDYFDIDENPESGSEFRWYNDTVLQESYNDASTVPASATSVGEEWYFTVRPGDGLDLGDLQTSPTATILANGPPTHDTPTIESSLGTDYSYENLTTTAQNVVDPDGNDVTNIYNWILDGTPYAALLMPFDTEDYGAAKDYSGLGNDGIIFGATWTPSGIVGGAYTFDGDYIRIPTDSSLGDDGTWTEMTIEYWINPDHDQLGARTINKNVEGTDATGIYMAGFNTAGSPNTVFWGVTIGGTYLEVASSGNTIPSGTWSHVVGTYESGVGIKLYIDGVLRDFTPGVVGPIDSSGSYPLFIGSSAGAGVPSHRYFYGTLDDVRIYPRALSGMQAYQRYMDTKDGFSATSTIASKETLGGEVWSCEVTPNDSYVDGLTESTGDLTVITIYFNVLIDVVGSGTTNPAPGTYLDILEATPYPVTAVPDPGWDLSHWLLNDTDVGSSNPYPLVMDADYNLTAVFAETAVLLVDNTFSASAGDADLDANTPGQDWYESRSAWSGGNVSLTTLDTSNVGGNTSPKLALRNYGEATNAYMAQEFSYQQFRFLTLEYDIFIEQIENVGNYDRTGALYIGTDTNRNNAPVAHDSEQFLAIAFRDNDPETDGDLTLRCMEPSDSFGNTGGWNNVASSLFYNTWYNVRLEINVFEGTYDVYLDDVLAEAGVIAHQMVNPVFATFVADSDGRGDFVVDNVYATGLVGGPAFHDLTIDVTDGGSTSPTNTTFHIEEGLVIPVTANPDSGWALDHWELDAFDVGSANPYDVTMDGDHELVAVFEEIVTNTIIVYKDAVPDDPQVFSFGGGLNTFDLDDDGVGDNYQTFTDLLATTYDIIELDTSGWELTGITIVDPDGESSFNLETKTATLDLDSGETITVTFTNEPGNTDPYVSWARVWGPSGRLDPGGTVARGNTVLLYAQVGDPETHPSLLTVTISYGQSSVWTSPGTAVYNAPKNEWQVYWAIPLDAPTGVYDVKVEVSDPHGGSDTLIEAGELEVVNIDPYVSWARVWGPSGRLDPGGTVARGNTVLLYAQVGDSETHPSLLTVTISYGQSSVWTSPGTAVYNAPKNEWYVYWAIPLDAPTGVYDVKVEVSDPDGGSDTLIEAGELEVVNIDPYVSWARVWGPGGRLDPGGTVTRGNTVLLYAEVGDPETHPSLLTVTISYGQSSVWTSPGTAVYNAPKNEWQVYWAIPLDAPTGVYDVKVEVSDPHGGSDTLIEAGELEVVNIAPVVAWSRVWGPGGRLDPGGTVTRGNTVLLYAEVGDPETHPSLLTVTISYGQSDVWTSPGTATYVPAKNEWHVYWAIPLDAPTGVYDVKVEVSDPDGGSDTLIEAGELEVVNIAPVVAWSRVWGPGGRLDPGGTVTRGNTVLLYAQVGDFETAPGDLTVTISYGQSSVWTSPGTATYVPAKNEWHVYWAIPLDAPTGVYDVQVEVSDPHGGSATAVEAGEFEVT